MERLFRTGTAGEERYRAGFAAGSAPLAGPIRPFGRIAAAASTAALETLSPTRCCGCERPGSLVCDSCLRELTLIDPRESCLRCAAPFGRMLCTECARDALHDAAGTAGSGSQSAEAGMWRTGEAAGMWRTGGAVDSQDDDSRVGDSAGLASAPASAGGSGTNSSVDSRDAGSRAGASADVAFGLASASGSRINIPAGSEAERAGGPAGLVFGSAAVTDTHAIDSAGQVFLFSAEAAAGARANTLTCSGTERAAQGPHNGTDAPFERCLAMATFDGPLPRIIRSYKDAGERRLAPLLAEMLLDALLHAEEVAPERYGGILSASDGIAFVPATAAAYRRRGFDHMEAIARELARMSEKPLVDALVKHGKTDQRSLGREERRTRSKGAYECVEDVRGRHLLLIDDVITTGATLRAAAAELDRAGAAHIDAVALARVW